MQSFPLAPRRALAPLAAGLLSLMGYAASDELSLNDLEYLHMPGLDVMLAHDYYPEGHQGGVSIILNGQRVATNGDLRLERAPGQWSPVPAKIGERVADPQTGAISCQFQYPDEARNRKGFNPIEYPDLAFTYRLSVQPDGGASFLVTVDLDQPLPPEWDGKVSFMLELFPGAFFGKSYLMDAAHYGIFPRQANGPGIIDASGAYQIEALATGSKLVVAPETKDLRLTVESLAGGAIELLDGRGEHSNGWFIARSELAPGVTDRALQWRVTPHPMEDWMAPPVIQISQVGYAPQQPKLAIVELDPRDQERRTMTLSRILPDGSRHVAMSQQPEEWGRFLRYHYLRMDFTGITEPGLYVVAYGEEESAPFQIGDHTFARHVWQPTLEYFLPVQMCHMRVNDRYRVWHGACHLDDARMAPVDHNHFDGYLQGPSTLSRFQPGERVPGLDRGGWHDAGDDDLRVESQAATVYGLALAFEAFQPLHDNTTIDQETLTVEIHRPDGKPDILQQIEHGALTLVGGYEALGRLYRGIITPTLRQYTLLGDTANVTDNLPFDAAAENPPAIGLGVEGSADDRWVFTRANPAHELISAAGLAAASRTLRDFNDPLAENCLQIAEDLWAKIETDQPVRRVPLAVELLLATGNRDYADFIVGQGDAIAKRFDTVGWTVGRALPRINNDRFRAKLAAAARAYSAKVDAEEKKTPYGVPYEPDIWGAGWGIQRFGAQQYFLHDAFPESFSPDLMLNALSFILGCHPGSNNASFVSGVGSNSLTVAYGLNRADWSYIPGGSASGTALIRPDYPELLTWPYLWQQTEYVLGGGTTDYLFLALAADHLARKRQEQ